MKENKTTPKMQQESFDAFLDELMKSPSEEKRAKTAEKRTKPKLAAIRLDRLHPFENHPYKVTDDDRMTELKESIAENGILSRIMVRPLENRPDEYEIIAGHRRVRAAELLGMKEVPAVIHFVDRDEAINLMVDSNIQREDVSIMEKGRAYRMKLDAMKRKQGERTDLTCAPLGHKLESQRSVQDLADDSPDSKTQIQRYIRLTYLIPELQEYADEGRIRLRPGVELSYLDEEAQRDVADCIEETEVFPSHAQARKLRTLFDDGKLNYKAVSEIMEELKPNQVEKLKIPMDSIRQYVPQNATPKDVEELIVRLVRQDYERRQRSRDDAR